MVAMPRPLVAIIGALAGLALVAACSKGSSGPSAPTSGCGSTLQFTVLPVPIGAIASATPVGNMNPPQHSVPTDHSGIYLNGTGIPLVAPGPLVVYSVNRARYVTSAFRQGTSDYTLNATACNGYQVVLGHIQAPVAAITNAATTDCQTYSTANETVESCRANNVAIPFAAGAAIGSVGGVTSPSFDFGLYAGTNVNAFVNASRYTGQTLTAVCAYDAFTPDLKAQLYGLIGYPGDHASGEAPQCGTMTVDVAGTAAGVWVLQSAPVNQAGDETNFLSLVPHPLYPQSAQVISAGLATLINTDAPPYDHLPALTSGRLNRRFRDVTGDGQVYCYVASLATSRESYMLRLSASNVLAIQKFAHAQGASPCAADPATWTITGSTTYIR